MPRTSLPGRAAAPAMLQVRIERFHCRHLNRLMRHAADNGRLRASRDADDVEIWVQKHSDPVIRRLFSLDDIRLERMALRSALARAAANMTPERLKLLGSPGRHALGVLQQLKGPETGHDIKVRQIRKAAALLAGERKRPSFTARPARTGAARLAQTGAAGLASGDSLRRLQLNSFCMDGAATASLPALLAQAGDRPGTLAASLSIFRAAAQTFVLETALAGTAGAPLQIARSIRRRSDSALLRLFIGRWLRAVAAGRFAGTAYPWFDAVNWLAGALHQARPASPGATRAPRSPRVASPASVAPARAQVRARTIASVTAPARRGRISTPVSATKVRPPAQHAAPPRAERLQEGRQGASRRMLNQLPSPPLRPARPRAAEAADKPAAVPAIAAVSDAPSQPPRPAPAVPPVTLLDALLEEYFNSQSQANSQGRESSSTDPASEETQ